MASTFLARRSVCMQLLRLSSHFSRPERIIPLAIRNRNNSVKEYIRHRRLSVSSGVQFSRDLSLLRGKREGMDGEGETTTPLASASDIKTGRFLSFFSFRSCCIRVRGKREGMDGEGETTTPLASTSDIKFEEQVAEERKNVEQEERVDTEDGKETDDKNREEVASWEGESFRLTGSCSLVLHRGDITKWYKDGKTDAIVNAANERMLGGRGVDGAIHRAAGRGLLGACRKVLEVSSGVRCPTGRAVITPGFKLPVAHVIHTVGPVYFSERDPAGLLSEAYKNSVALAIENELKYIAFPAVSCGVYGYPYNEAAKVSIQVLQESAGQLLEVHFVLFEAGTYAAWRAEAEDKLQRLSKSQG